MNDTWAEEKMNFTGNVLDQFDIAAEKAGGPGEAPEQVTMDLLEKMPNIAFGE